MIQRDIRKLLSVFLCLMLLCTNMGSVVHADETMPAYDPEVEADSIRETEAARADAAGDERTAVFEVEAETEELVGDDGGVEETLEGLWIGAVQVTEENASDILGDGTVSFDSGTGTLTFASADPAITGTTKGALIYANAGDLVIDAPQGLVLSGDEADYGIFMVDAALAVRGSLDINVPGTAIESTKEVRVTGDVTVTAGTGITTVRGDVYIGGSAVMTTGDFCMNTVGQAGTVTIEGDAHLTSTDGSTIAMCAALTFGGNAELYGNGSYLVCSLGDITIRGDFTGENKNGTGLFAANSGKIVIGGNADAKANGDYIFFGMTGIEIGGSVKGEGGKGYILFTPSGDIKIVGSADLTSSQAYLIYASNGSVETGSVTGASPNGYGIGTPRKDIRINGDAKIRVKGAAITAYEGKIEISGDADLTSEGSEVLIARKDLLIEGSLNARGSSSYALLVQGNVEIDGDVTFENTREDGSGFLVPYGSITVAEGSVWHVKAGGGALYAKEGINIPDSSKITMPENASVDTYDSDRYNDTFYTVLDAGGSPAAEVIIERDPALPFDGLWLGATQVTEENASDILGDGTVSFDSGTGTLTFASADPAITGTTKGALIYANAGDLVIDAPQGLVLSGDEADYGIFMVDAALAVRGSLDINVPGTAIESTKEVRVTGDVTVTAGTGITTDEGNIYIGGSAVMTTGDFCMNTEGYAGTVTIEGDAHLTSTDGSTIAMCAGATFGGNAELYGNGSYLICCLGDITIHGDFTGENKNGNGLFAANSGKLIIGGNADAKANGDYIFFGLTGIEIGGSVKGEGGKGYILFSPSGDIKIVGSADLTSSQAYLIYAPNGSVETGSVTGASPNGYGVGTPRKDIRINGDAKIRVKGAAIAAYEGKIEISGDADLTSEGSEVLNARKDLLIEGSLNARGSSIYALLVQGNVEIDGNVTVENTNEGGSGFLVPYGCITVAEGSVWQVKAGGGALYAKEGINIPDSSKITMPENASVDTYDSDRYNDTFYTVLDAGGSPAAEVVIEPDPAGAVTLKAAAVSFEGMIRLRYTLNIPDVVCADADAYLTFEKNGEVVQTELLSAGVPHDEDMYFYLPVRAPEFADDVVLRVCDGEGNPIRLRSEYGTDYTETGFAYSAKAYAERMAVNASTEQMRNLAHALFDYGTAAQIYFEYGDISGLGSDEHVTGVALEDLDSYKLTASGTKPAGVTSASISAEFDKDNSVRITYKLDGSHPASDYTFMIDGVETPPGRKGSSATLTVKNIAAPDLDEAHTFSVTDGVNTYTVTASALSYARTCIKNGDAARANLGRALYLYNKAANDYFVTIVY